MPDDNFARFRNMLKKHGVLSAPLAKRYFGLDVSNYEKAYPVFDLVVRPVDGRVTSTQLVTFVALRPAHARRWDENQIGHVVGTAAMLLEIKASVDQYDCEPQAGGRIYTPDAALNSPVNGHVALEYDTGSYPRRVCLKKAERFLSDYPRMLWGTSNAARVPTLRNWFEGAGGRVKVIAVDYWSYPEL